MSSYEQGPIRPPSEAHSLLVRVSRNCPWNRCVFCPVYEDGRFSFRDVDEILADLDALLAERGPGARTVFLQDANPLLTKAEPLTRVLAGLYARFPKIERVTAYARADILARRSLADLQRIRQAGLHRLHVGLESGCDAVLQLICKGVTRAQAIEAGQKVKAAGFELSEYVMPGIGGRTFSNQHADDTASALRLIGPDFVRLRTTTMLPGTELAAMSSRGEFELLPETAVVAEIRRFVAALGDCRTRLESDHVMNLLMHVRGNLPDERERLLAVCDEFLELPKAQQQTFILGRRLGRFSALRDLQRQPRVVAELGAVLDRLTAQGKSPEAVFAELRGQVI